MSVKAEAKRRMLRRLREGYDPIAEISKNIDILNQIQRHIWTTTNQSLKQGEVLERKRGNSARPSSD